MDKNKIERYEKKEIHRDTVYILYIYQDATKKFKGYELVEMLKWLCSIVPHSVLCEGTEVLDAIEAAFALNDDLSPDEEIKLRALYDFYLGTFDGKVLPPPEIKNIFKKIVKRKCTYDWDDTECDGNSD